MHKIIGKTLQERYQITREVGHGGYGTVFLAEDQQLQRQVAIKRLHQGLTQARFRREALAMASLKHPHIIEIYDVFQEGDSLYQVMEYAEAGSLEALLSQTGYRQGMPVDEAVEIGKSLASALKDMHQRHIIHRDLKPSNVLLGNTKDGWVIKLADFGVAHLPLNGKSLTHTGDILGTLPYLAPEQIKGSSAQPKSDVYALGILLYRLLTNSHYLILDSDSHENRRRILEETARPVSEIRSDVPIWL
ncbi:MAG: serine/threonine-protein kinase, partial [Chloroflexota bacterium]